MAVIQTHIKVSRLHSELPLLRIDARRSWLALDLPELWAYRELLYFFVWRDIKVRYKQTVIGAAWAILQPLLTMLGFSMFFGRLAKIPSRGLPYPVFYYCALLPWTYFATAMQAETNVVVGQQRAITKVYFSACHIADFFHRVWTFRSRDFLRCIYLHDVQLPYHSNEGSNVATRFYIICGVDGPRCGLVAVRLECPVLRCPVRLAIPRAVLDVRVTGCLSKLTGYGKVARALWAEPDGRGHRGISMGIDGPWSTSWGADGCFVGSSGTASPWRAHLLPCCRGQDRGRGLND